MENCAFFLHPPTDPSITPSREAIPLCHGKKRSEKIWHKYSPACHSRFFYCNHNCLLLTHLQTIIQHLEPQLHIHYRKCLFYFPLLFTALHGCRLNRSQRRRLYVRLNGEKMCMFFNLSWFLKRKAEVTNVDYPIRIANLVPFDSPKYICRSA